MTQVATYDERPLTMPEGLDFSPKETNRRLLYAAWKTAGAKPRYPLDTRTVFAVLKLMGYEATRERLDYCLQREYMPKPDKDRGAFIWREADVINFADALESLRAWLPMHPCHKHKLTPDEFAKALGQAAAAGSAVKAFVEMPFHELLDLLAKCNVPQTRELMVAAIKVRTGLIHLKGAEQVPALDPSEAN